MASPSAKRRRLDLLNEGARRSPRLQENVTGSTRRSGHLSPKKLFSSQEGRQKESISSLSFYNNASSLLKDDVTSGNQKTKGPRASKGKKTKNKLWSSGPRLGGRGIPVNKMSKALKSQQRSQAKKTQGGTHGKKAVQKHSPLQKSILQEVSLGKLSLSNNAGPASESNGPKKFFKSRDRRPETIVLKTGFDIKFKSDAVANLKSAKKETVVRKIRPLSVLGGKCVASKTPRMNSLKRRTKENEPSFSVAEVQNNSNIDILDVTDGAVKPSVPRTPRTPSTREEEMLASWGFDSSFEMPNEGKMNSRSSEVKRVERRSVLSPQDLLLTPLDETSQSSLGIQSDSQEDTASAGKPKLFPIFTPSAKWANGTLSGTPTSSPGGDNKRRKLRANKDKDGKEQYMLDAGQKLTGLIQCSTCGMSYNGDSETDEDVHEKFHNNILKTLSFQGWKCENVVREFSDGSRIIMVYADNKKQMQKVEKIRDIVDMELGFVQTNKSIKPNRKIFLYASPKKEIAGYCLAEPIEKAYKLLTDSPRKNARSSPRKKPLRCSDVAVPVKCGINRIWVFHNYRHQGIATKLLDCVRFNFLNGYPLTLEELAYTDPTPDGRALFSNYNGHAQYMVYN